MTDQLLVSSLSLTALPIFSVLWVLRDARRHASDGHPVEVYLGDRFSVVTPETWAIACLFVWIFFFPLYIVARTQT